MMLSVDLALTECRLATMRANAHDAYGLVDDAALLISEGAIVWAGAAAALPAHSAGRTERLGGRLVTPGLIDCHTHLVFAGNRAAEFEQRLHGATYTAIAAAGGGIASTVRATNGCSVEELVHLALPRLEALLRDGVTTVEIKSGYALDHDGELRMLRAARALAAHSVHVSTTFLGLHSLPGEYAGRADAYVDRVIAETLPAVAAEKLADAVDAYVEPIAFSVAQAERFFLAAAELGLPAKIHADQLSAGGGTALAARVRALSADHAEYADEEAIAALARAGTAAVLLPGAYLTLRERQAPPIAALRAAGVPFAVATDCNPGTSPLASPLLAMNLACTLFGLTPAEALAGTTRHAARALGLAGVAGELTAGSRADLAVWNVATPAELSYWLGLSPLHVRYIAGELARPSHREARGEFETAARMDQPGVRDEP